MTDPAHPLARYAMHLRGCPRFVRYDGGASCTCGLDTALTTPPPAPGAVAGAVEALCDRVDLLDTSLMTCAARAEVEGQAAEIARLREGGHRLIDDLQAKCTHAVTVAIAERDEARARDEEATARVMILQAEVARLMAERVGPAVGCAHCGLATGHTLGCRTRAWPTPPAVEGAAGEPGGDTRAVYAVLIEHEHMPDPARSLAENVRRALRWGPTPPPAPTTAPGATEPPTGDHSAVTWCTKHWNQADEGSCPGCVAIALAGLAMSPRATAPVDTGPTPDPVAYAAGWDAGVRASIDATRDCVADLDEGAGVHSAKAARDILRPLIGQCTLPGPATPGGEGS